MKILLIAPSEGVLGRVGDWVENALVSLDRDCMRFDYRKRRLPVIALFRTYVAAAERLDAIKMNADLVKAVRSYGPDVILVLFGERISTDTLDMIRGEHKPILANWFYDTAVSPYRKSFLGDYPKHYDYFFIMDSLKVLERVRIDCKNVVTLPAACDENAHKKVELSQRELSKYKSDVSFIGVVNPARREMLEYISRDPDIDLGIWAPRKSLYGDLLKDAPALVNRYRGGPLPYDEVMKVASASKIVLNIHGFSGEEHFDLPLRIFDTAGCGAFQLVEYTDTLERYFEIGKEIVCYSGKEDLGRLIKYYLAHDDERQAIAANAQKRVYREHTYRHRVRELLNILKKD